MGQILLTDEEIEQAKAQAEKDAWSHKAHPRFEKEKTLLRVQLKKVVEWLKKHNDFNEYGAERKSCGLLLTIKDWQALLKEIK